MQKTVLILILALCFVAPAGLDPSTAGAQGLAAIKPVPSLNNQEDEFDGYAYTDLVDGLAIIVDMDHNEVQFTGDAIYPLANRVEYYDIEGNRTSRSRFRAGKPAGCKLNPGGQVESLWEAREHER